jgi:hypothetical protein
MKNKKTSKVWQNARLYNTKTFKIFNPDMSWYTYVLTTKGVSFMKNRNFIIGLAFAGLAIQVFTLVCGDALLRSYSDAFNAVSAITLFLALIGIIWNQPTPNDRVREIDDIYRDMDQIYRYIDDNMRDIHEEIRDSQKN